ncbi:MAG: DUF2905 domain-containing protein [Bryobacteraceae bacterium]|nr:DUF2905 domain-containing protein [Bryobacteraceae bacterium]
MNVGRMLIVAGAVLIAAGLLWSFGARLPFKPGQLPGDIVVRGRNSTFYFPIATSILLSILVTLVLWLVNRTR